MIDQDGNSVPLDEVYNHHSVYAYHNNSVPYVAEGMSPATLKSQKETYAAGLSFAGGPCTTYESAGGVGAEGRNTGGWTPAGFGYVYDTKENWNSNMHVINLRNVTDVRNCVQCGCEFMGTNPFNVNLTGEAPYKNGGGGIPCCQNGAVCPTSLPEGDRGEGIPYKYRYTVKYIQLSDDFAAAKETTPYVQLSMYPHTDRSIAPQNYGYQVCEYEFNSPVCETPETPDEWPAWILPYTECEAGPDGGTRAIISKNYTVAQDLLLIHFQGHMHNGGLVLELFANGTEPEDLLCASKARYGTGANDTGSKGFLVELGECLWEDGLPVSAGTELIVKSTYVATPADQIADDPGAQQIAFGAPFDGVMAYGMLQAVPASGEIEGFLLEPDAPPPSDDDAAQCIYSDFIAFNSGSYDNTVGKIQRELATGNSTVTFSGDDVTAQAGEGAPLYQLVYKADEEANQLYGLLYFVGIDSPWLGVGFNPPGSSGMKNADIIIGQRMTSASGADADLGAAQEAELESAVYQVGSYWSSTQAKPAQKTKAQSPGVFGANLKNCAMGAIPPGEEGYHPAGASYLMFQRPLIYPDGADPALITNLEKGQEYNVIFAFGPGALAYHGQNKGIVEGVTFY